MREYKAEFLAHRRGEIGRPRFCKLVVHAEDERLAEEQIACLGYDCVQDLVLTEQPLSGGFAPPAAPAAPAAPSAAALVPDPPVVEPVESIKPETSDPAPPSPRKTRTRKVV